jgi:hypothetical protein
MAAEPREVQASRGFCYVRPIWAHSWSALSA